MVLYCNKKLLVLLRGIASKHSGGYYCLSCLHLFRIKNKLESQIEVYENKDFCNVVIHLLKTLKY